MDDVEHGAKPTVLLDRWMLARSRRWPEQTVLFGIAYRHPRVREGRGVRTTLVLDLDIARRRAETVNTVYRLLRPAPDAEALEFPWAAFFERVDVTTE